MLRKHLNMRMAFPKDIGYFFVPWFTPMGGMEQNYKTRKGNTARRLVAVFNTLPTSLENEAYLSTRSIHVNQHHHA